ncbi:helix-turn-helix domain-containing protein [Bradyrhizobium sp. A5]|uniref:helix-turn-helix domain-containing protein n=1 Tax=Bradyrhizobium sp. A5 TaxID=3133696 RepID=UPI003243F129
MFTPIPVLHFDTGNFPEADRFDIWRSGIATHEVTRLEAGAPFGAAVDAWTLGDMVVTHSRIGPVRMARTAEMARADRLDMIQVVFIKDGTVTFTTDDEPSPRTMRQGELAAFDTRRALLTDGTALDCITCTIARRAFQRAGYDPSTHGQIIDGAWARLVADFLLSFVQQLEEMSVRDAASLSAALVGLLTTTLSARPASGDTAPGRSVTTLRERAEIYIDQQLGSDKLDIVSMSRDLATSKSNLYRAFAGGGGVTTYIRRRRLETIHARLNAGKSLSIGDVARQYGFTSAAHFSRAFRKQFGFSPRHTRLAGIARPPVEVTDEVSMFRHWEEKLR